MSKPIELTSDQIAQIAAAIKAANPSLGRRIVTFSTRYRQGLVGILIGFALCFGTMRAISTFSISKQSEILEMADREAALLPFPNASPSPPLVEAPPSDSMPAEIDTKSTSTCDGQSSCSPRSSGTSSRTRYLRRLILRN